jgi:hypothetical protein
VRTGCSAVRKRVLDWHDPRDDARRTPAYGSARREVGGRRRCDVRDPTNARPARRAAPLGSPDRLDVAVEKQVANIFTKLDLAPSGADHRRVLAVLRYLDG